jgi:hypothetical protein
VARADGQVESWVSSGALDGLGWPPPARLGVDWTTKESFETGYNSGNVLSARSGSIGCAGRRASGQFDVLAAAAQMDDELALVYLRAGEIVGYRGGRMSVI